MKDYLLMRKIIGRGETFLWSPLWWLSRAAPDCSGIIGAPITIPVAAAMQLLINGLLFARIDGLSM